jgi:hypothetical protein
MIRDLQVLSVRQEVRKYSVTYRQRLNDHPNSLAKSLFQTPNYNRRLKRYYPADLATRFNWYSATPPETKPNHLWLRLNRRRITGCISHMPLIVTVNTIAECLRTYCNILGDKIKKKLSYCTDFCPLSLCQESHLGRPNSSHSAVHCDLVHEPGNQTHA